MFIKKLEIKHYKSFEHEAVIKPSALNIFIGQNNCGKTNILDALEYLITRNVSDRFSDPHASVEMDIETAPGELFTLRVHENVFREEDYGAVHRCLPHFIRLGRDRLFVPEKQYLDTYQDLLQHHPQHAKNFADKLHQYFPEIDLSLLPRHIGEYGKERILERLGSGFQQFFIILLYLYHPMYTVIVIDEPEIHLHPALLRKLLHVMKDQTLHNQIFLTTNSPLLVQTDHLHHIHRVVRDQERMSSVIYSFTNTLSLDTSRLIQELNADNSEMFLADTVLLVEGVSDRILMRGLINGFYHGGKEIKVIYVAGKDNVDVYVKLLQAFHIPYLVLLDHDALRDRGIRIIQDVVESDPKGLEREKISRLKQYHIFVLPNGAIEDNYPKKYQKQSTKPLCSLYAASFMTEEEFRSPVVKNLREVIENL